MELFKLFGRIAIENSEADAAIDNTTDKAEKSGGKISAAFSKMGGVAKKVAIGIGTAGLAIGGAMVSLAESTREYRTEMGKLDTAFVTAGHSSEAAKKTYSDLNAVLGDTGQAVEAANHLAKLVDNEKDLQTWTDICTGVYATFGDSLPIEGLTEAANETAKVGQVTGAVADALNWAGISEDEFNAKLEACTTEQERQKLIMDTLNETYKDASDQYKETNKDIMDSYRAQERLTNITAKLGEVAEPIVTMGKNAIASLAEKALPFLENMIGGISGIEDVISTVGGKVSTFMAPMIAAFQNLGSVIAKDAEDSTFFQDAFSIMSEAIGNIWTTFGQPVFDGIITAVNWLADNWGVISEGISTSFQMLWEGCQTVWTNIGQPIWDIISFTITSLENLFSENMPAIMKFFQDAIAGIQDTWENHLKPTFDAIGIFLKDVVKPAFEFVFKTIIEPLIKTVFSTISNLWNNTLKPVFDGICDFLTGVFTGDWKKAFNGILNIVKGVFNAIVTAVRLPMTTMKNIVNTAIEFIKSKFNFQWSLPKLKLPHFTVSGGFSLNPLSVPSFGIEWYSKAMENGMIMEQPTAFGINKNGEIMAGGEAGSETIVGTQSLMSMIREAVNGGVSAEAIAYAVKEAVLEGLANIDISANINVVPDDRGILKIVEKQAKIKERATGRKVFA